MEMRHLRGAFTQEIERLATEDKTIFALATDSRGSVTLTDFAKHLPEQFVECGIAEQDAVGIAAGLANSGLRPFVCGPACFYSMRSAEQVKVDVAYSHTNVKIIGVSGGVSYGALGSTHHSTQDIALMRAIPGLEVFIPSDAVQMTALTDYLAKSDIAAYVRVGRGAVPVFYDVNASFTPGKAVKLKTGCDGAIIACGEMVYPALKAADKLNDKGYSFSVYDMFCIKPLDTIAILEAADTGFVLTAEEHSVYGGLGGAVSEVLSQVKPVPMTIMGLPDEKTFSGNSAEVLAHYGLTSEGIYERAVEGLKKWKSI
ncbi:MAG: transketolase family protein [Clostridiales bacterium]|nr:transketolase family protein [Clostridiales bacterium]